MVGLRRLSDLHKEEVRKLMDQCAQHLRVVAMLTHRIEQQEKELRTLRAALKREKEPHA